MRKKPKARAPRRKKDRRLPHMTCANTEWFTPPHVLDAVRSYFGGEIALDPATTAANHTKAKAFFTVKENGLARPFVNGTFVNPPYGTAMPAWCAKIGEEAARGVEIIALLTVSRRTEQEYWQRAVLNDHLRAICFVRGRLQFLDERGSPGKRNSYPSELYGYNVDRQRFEEVFVCLGRCLRLE